MSAILEFRFHLPPLMFLVLLTYTASLEVIDSHLAAHREFLQRHYDAGTLLISGPKEPRDGGVILARAESAEQLQQVLAEDPFHQHGVATYQVLQFTPRMAAPELQHLLA